MNRRILIPVLLTFAMMSAVAFAATPAKVVVNMKDAKGDSVGTITVRQHKQGVRFYLMLKDLPTGVHAFHVHETASCVPPDFKSSGGHFNPTHAHHGLKNPAGPHAGDMVNITIGPSGSSHQVIDNPRVTLEPGKPNSLFANGGTALVIHAGVDDMMSDPAGNAGARIACGVITR
jgi:superoxide dismutase, Cu-Zn family